MNNIKKRGLFTATALTLSTGLSFQASAFSSCLTYGDYAYAESYCESENSAHPNTCSWSVGTEQENPTERRYFIQFQDSRYNPVLVWEGISCTSYKGQ